VLVLGRLLGASRLGEGDLDVSVAWVWTVDAGRIVAMEAFREERTARQAIALARPAAEAPAAARKAPAPGLLAQRKVRAPVRVTGRRVFFHSATPPGPQSFGKEGNGPDAVVRARCRRPRQSRGNHYRIPASAASYGSYRDYRRAKPDNRHRGGLVSRPLPDPYLADPVKPRRRAASATTRCRSSSTPGHRDPPRFHNASTAPFATCLSAAAMAHIPRPKRPPRGCPRQDSNLRPAA
jgi:hypothetical protein